MEDTGKKEASKMRPKELIHLPKTSLVIEIMRLRAKINLLIEKHVEVSTREEQRINDNQELEIVGKRQEQKQDIELALQMVRQLSKELQHTEKWIPFKNNTPNSRDYYRMRRIEFEKVLAELGGDRKISQLLVDIGVIKPSQKGPITTVNADGRYVAAYVIRKSAVDALGVDDE